MSTRVRQNVNCGEEAYWKVICSGTNAEASYIMTGIADRWGFDFVMGLQCGEWTIPEYVM